MYLFDEQDKLKNKINRIKKYKIFILIVAWKINSK